MELRKLMTAVGGDNVKLAPYAAKLGQSWSEDTIKRYLAFHGSVTFWIHQGFGFHTASQEPSSIRMLRYTAEDTSLVAISCLR